MSEAMASIAATTRGVTRRLTRAVTSVCVAALGLLSCSTPLLPSVPAAGMLEPANVIDVKLPPPAAIGWLKAAVVEATADVNLRPIRLWFVEDAGNVKALYVIGHADGECCPEISGILHNVASLPGIKNGWLSFGYGHFEAASAEGAATLARIRAKIEKKSSESVCNGQVAVTRSLSSNLIHDDSAKLVAVAGSVFDKAKELDRPIVLSHRFNDAHPRIVPATVAGPSGVANLEFRIPVKELAPPRLVTRSFNLDGIAQAISAIRAEIARLDTESVDPASGAALRDSTIKTNYRAPQGIADITVSTSRIDALLDKLRRSSSSAATRARAVSVLQESKRMNGAALATIMALSDSPSSTVVIHYRKVASRPNPAAIAERARLASMLNKWEKRRSKASANTIQPELVDAFLRGWPAAFGDSAAELAYADWLVKHQKHVWKYVYDQLAKRGIDTGEPDGPGVLQKSNVVFRVRAEGGVMVVTPLFVVTGPTLLVADTAAGLVHYELSTADQNLAAP